MRSIFLSCLVLGAGIQAWCDDFSGPKRITFVWPAWGTISYEPVSLGACRLESSLDGFRLASAQGEVQIQGSDLNGYRLGWKDETLTIRQTNGDLEIRRQDGTWTLKALNGRVTLTSPAPKDSVVFERSHNAFRITGAKGTVAVAMDYNNSTLRIESPAGVSTVITSNGKRIFTGPALDQIPYLGRGFYIPFHGVWVFVDVAKRFPMPEVVGWVEWKSIFEP